MYKARHNPLTAIAAHAALVTWTLIALFPVAVILINAFKTRKAIVREPLALPTSESFSMIGYQTVLKQGDFFLYFQNSMIVTAAAPFFILLFGAMAALALSKCRARGKTLMGLYLALAHHRLPGAEIVGLVNPSPVALPEELTGYRLFNDFRDALSVTRPEVVVIATHSDSHADYAVAALKAGVHVFVEKPLATTVADARRVVDCAGGEAASSSSAASCVTTPRGSA